jgi:hypothetical protein
VKIPLLLLKSGDIPEFIRISGLNSFEELNGVIELEQERARQNKEL